MWSRFFVMMAIMGVEFAQAQQVLESDDTAALKRPNIILFYVDDLGWMDIGVQGSKFYETPNIDRLANEGVRYTQGYTPHPRCLPARYGGLPAGSLPAAGSPVKAISNRMTGQWRIRSGMADTKPVSRANGISRGRMAKKPAAEYGLRCEYCRGCRRCAADLFLPAQEANFENEAGLEIGLDKEYVAGLEDGKEGDYITDVITDKSIDFIEDNKDNPFFLYLSHYGVHTPFEAPERLVKKYRKNSRP